MKDVDRCTHIINEEDYPELISAAARSRFAESKGHARWVIFKFGRRTEGDVFMEIAIVSSTVYNKFVIAPGFRMSEDHEREFNEVCRLETTTLSIDSEWFDTVQEKFREYFDISIRHYNSDELQGYLHRIYYSSHPCVQQELYKLGLEEIAAVADIISDREELIGMPPELLSVAEAAHLSERLIKKCLREEMLDAYRKFHDCFKGERLMNRWQFLYLLECETIGGTNSYCFRKEFFDALSQCSSDIIYTRYKDYLRLSGTLGVLIRNREFQGFFGIRDDTVLPRVMARNLRNYGEIDREIGHENNLGLSYEDEEYLAVEPKGLYEIITEAFSQNEELLCDTDDFASGKTHVIFMGSKINPRQPHCTIEINADMEIVSVYAGRNGCETIPTRADYRAIESFAERNHLVYDPRRLMFDRYDLYTLCESSDHLLRYLDDFDRRHGMDTLF